MNVKTNVGKIFFELLQKHFLPTQATFTIFNKTKKKTIYGCCPNMGSIISLHDKHILDSNRTEYGCNCSNTDEFLSENKCFNYRIVYRADVVTSNRTDEHKYNYVISGTLW